MNRLWTPRNPQRQQMPYPRRRSGLPLGLAVGLAACVAACGNGAQSAPVTAEQAGQPAGQPPAAQAGASEPRAQDLIVPPPERARFDADLSSSATEQWHVVGSERRVSGSEGTWEGQDAQVYVYTTDRSFEEVHAYYMDAARQLGMMHGNGEIEEEPLDAIDPDAMQGLAEMQGFPQRFVDAYRQIYPSLQGRTGRSAEFSFFDRGRAGAAGQTDSFRIVDVEILHPYANLFAGELREQTGIQYTVVTMARTGGR